MFQRGEWRWPILLATLLAAGCGPSAHQGRGGIQPVAGHPSYEFIPDPQEKLKGKLVFQGAPAYVHSLPMCPPALEEMVKHGDWLVLAFGWFSQTDMNCVGKALEVAMEHRGALNLGVRPFFRYEEMLTWFPDYDGPLWSASPVWVLYRDGKVVRSEAGPLEVGEVRKFVTGLPGVKKGK